MKRCGSCGETKPLDDFHRRNKVADGRQAWCKQCATAATLAARAKNPERSQQSHRLRKYGLSQDEFQALIDAQNGLCGICSRVLDEPCVDHCHISGDVRGLLCRRCNTSIGQLSDDPYLAALAVAWLLRPRTAAPSTPDDVTTQEEGRSA